MTKLDWALRWYDWGFSVIPVHYPVDGGCSCRKADCSSPGKHPALRSWIRFQKKRATRDNLESWFEEDGPYEKYNLGVITGTVSGNAFVPDVDVGPDKEGAENLYDLQLTYGELPQTLVTVTGSGGNHFFFKAPVGVITKTDKDVLAKHIDNRGEGGFVVVPPSVHVSGDQYYFRSEDDMQQLAAAPEWVLERVVEDYKKEKPEIEYQKDQFGRIEDGREAYMLQVIIGTIRTWWETRGLVPTLEQLLEDAWPTYETHVKARGEDLDADGRGLKEFTKKAKYWISRGIDGKMNALEGIEPGSDPQEDASAEKKPVIKLTDHWLSTYAGDPPVQEFLIDPILSLGVPGIFAGQGGVGKSFLLLDTVIKIAAADHAMHQEQALGGRIATSGVCVYITAEDSRSSVHRRIASITDSSIFERAKDKLIVVALPDLGGPQTFMFKDFDTYKTTRAFADLRDQLLMLAKEHRLVIVVLDPMQPFTAADINSDPAACQFFWGKMAEICASIKCNIIVAHHMRKEGAWSIKRPAQAREAIRGSSALVDASRWAYALYAMPEHEEEVLAKHFGFEPGTGAAVCGAVVKSNDKADMSPRFYIRGENGLLVDRTSEVANIIDDAANLEADQIRQIMTESRRRWSDGNPFSIATNTPRSFIGFLKSEYGLSHYSAKEYMNGWIHSGQLVDQVHSTHTNKRGLKPSIMN